MKTELSYKVKKLLEPLGHKHWTEAQQKKITPLLDHVTRIERTVKALDEELRHLRQVSLLDPPEDKYGGRASTLQDEERVSMDLDRFCYDAVEELRLESQDFQRFMKFRGWTLKEVMLRHGKYQESL